MTDDEFAAALQAFFDANDLYDGIDRSEGYNDEYRFERLAIVRGDDGFDDLHVTVDDDGTTRVARVLFDRAWREASGLEKVGAYAAYVVARWRTSLLDETDAGDVAPGAADDDLEGLLKGVYGNVNRPASGVFEVVDDDGDVFTVHIGTQEWRRLAGSGGQAALDELEELAASRWDDEDHLVFFRGSFHRSIRAELPPLRSKLLLDAGATS